MSTFNLREYLGVTERTIKNRVNEFSDEYSIEKGIISIRTSDGK